MLQSEASAQATTGELAAFTNFSLLLTFNCKNEIISLIYIHHESRSVQYIRADGSRVLAIPSPWSRGLVCRRKTHFCKLKWRFTVYVPLFRSNYVDAFMASS